MSLFVKAYLPSAEGNYPEIRRFQISLDGPSKYQEFEEKVAGFFPSLKNETFKIYWKDDEGEKIIISSDVELMVALNHPGQGDLFKIYLQTANKASGEEEHPGVICDGCDGKVMGSRFKCCICPDYDLCGTCESRGLHQEHHMYRFRQPLQRPVDPWRTFMQHCYRGSRPYCKRSGCGVGKCGGGKCGTRGDKDKDKKPSKSQQEETRKFLKEVEGGLRGFLNTMGIDFTLDVAMDDTEKPTDASGKSAAGGHSEKPSYSGAGSFPWQQFCGGAFPFGSCPTGATECPAAGQRGAEAMNGAGNTAEEQHMADGFEDPMKDIMEVTLEQLKGMGFTDEDQWLTTLVRAKNGDLNKVLDALRMPPDAQA